MQVSLSNGCVEITTRHGRRTTTHLEFYKGIILSGETVEEQVASFDYSRRTCDKDLRKKLREKQKDGLIKLRAYSIEMILGLQGIPPGYSPL